jgi:hypothetical protein
MVLSGRYHNSWSFFVGQSARQRGYVRQNSLVADAALDDLGAYTGRTLKGEIPLMTAPSLLSKLPSPTGRPSFFWLGPSVSRGSE